MPLARISLILSRHFSLSFIASGRSSGLHPVSSHSCCMYVLAGRPTLARPYVGVHRSTSLMSSSLLLQQCPACLVRRTWIVFVMGGRWPYSWYFVGVLPPGEFNYQNSRNVWYSSGIIMRKFIWGVRINVKTRFEHDRKLYSMKSLFLCPFWYTRLRIRFSIRRRCVSPFNSPRFKLSPLLRSNSRRPGKSNLILLLEG